MLSGLLCCGGMARGRVSGIIFNTSIRRGKKTLHKCLAEEQNRRKIAFDSKVNKNLTLINATEGVLQRGFEIDDVQGNSQVVLRRTLPTGEKVTVDFDCQVSDTAEYAMMIPFQILVEKESSPIIVSITCVDSQGVVICSIRNILPHQKVSDTAVYKGPHMKQVSEALKFSLQQYLIEHLGVDALFGKFVSAYAASKASKERLVALKNIVDHYEETE